MKIKVKQIEIGFSESKEVKPCTVKTFEEANRVLNVKAPDLGYYKTDFIVTWEDGQTFSDRYDIDGDKMRLQKQIANCLNFHAGTFCPSHWTPAQHAQALKNTSSEALKQEAITFLENYQLED